MQAGLPPARILNHDPPKSGIPRFNQIKVRSKAAAIIVLAGLPMGGVLLRGIGRLASLAFKNCIISDWEARGQGWGASAVLMTDPLLASRSPNGGSLPSRQLLAATSTPKVKLIGAIGLAMRRVWTMLASVALAASPCCADAAGQAPPRLGLAPLCAAKLLALQTTADASPMTVTVSPISAAPACIDHGGDILTLTSVAMFTNGATGVLKGDNQVEVSNIRSGGTTFTYTVTDSRGAAVRTTFTVKRP